MKKTNLSTRGFHPRRDHDLVVIIGLLAAMAIPAFQKVRSSSQDKTVLNQTPRHCPRAPTSILGEWVSTVDSSNLVARPPT